MIAAQAPVPGDAQLLADAQPLANATYLAIEQHNGEDAQDRISVAATCGRDPISRTVSRLSRALVQAPTIMPKRPSGAEDGPSPGSKRLRRTVLLSRDDEDDDDLGCV